MYSILEQLYEDLNSFSETSIRIDSFNSIELKIFPFYPNPPKVDDWQVPIALINLAKRVESNWDLTMAKVRLSALFHCKKANTRTAGLLRRRYAQGRASYQRDQSRPKDCRPSGY